MLEISIVASAENADGILKALEAASAAEAVRKLRLESSTILSFLYSEPVGRFVSCCSGWAETTSSE